MLHICLGGFSVLFEDGVSRTLGCVQARHTPEAALPPRADLPACTSQVPGLWVCTHSAWPTFKGFLNFLFQVSKAVELSMKATTAHHLASI